MGRDGDRLERHSHGQPDEAGLRAYLRPLPWSRQVGGGGGVGIAQARGRRPADVQTPTGQGRFAEELGQTYTVSLLASHQGDQCSIPGRVTLDFRMRVSYRTMPLVGGSSRGSPISPALSFRRCSIPHLPSSALKTSMLSAVQISSLRSDVNTARLVRRSDEALGSLKISLPRFLAWNAQGSLTGSSIVDEGSGRQVSNWERARTAFRKLDEEAMFVCRFVGAAPCVSRLRRLHLGLQSSARRAGMSWKCGKTTHLLTGDASSSGECCAHELLPRWSVYVVRERFAYSFSVLALSLLGQRGAAVAQWLELSLLTEPNRLDSRRGHSCMWESYRSMSLVGGFCQGSPVFPVLSFRCCSISRFILSLAVKTSLRAYYYNIFTPPWVTASANTEKIICARSQQLQAVRLMLLTFPQDLPYGSPLKVERIEASRREDDCMPAQWLAYKDDQTFNACRYMTLSACALLGLESAKYLQPDGTLN
ncbi:hypothetical protein PR048_002234 [Dryococelus australis]|uniref:Uncharacterized protein n=1 Tax=Dryococelus australis TaxID=614101 RepID=A0ABQ9IM40_9NEOP|nr:hypothetical protein PR048_002234 [Dryococelus australis]